MLRPDAGRDWVALDASPLPVADAIAWATTPASGAVASFVGVVRDHSEGRPDVTGITYEAYPEVAERRMVAVAAAARTRWPAVDRLALLHRIGDVELSEPSVVVVVSSAHRPEAFAAAQFCIDTLKASVPIWKREHWSGGSAWVECASAARPVEESA